VEQGSEEMKLEGSDSSRCVPFTRSMARVSVVWSRTDHRTGLSVWSRSGPVYGLVCGPDSTGTARSVPDRLGPSWRDDLEFRQNLHRIVRLCVKLVSNMWNILFYQRQGGVWPREMPIDAVDM
jgi:hypothetical protein